MRRVVTGHDVHGEAVVLQVFSFLVKSASYDGHMIEMAGSMSHM